MSSGLRMFMMSLNKQLHDMHHAYPVHGDQKLAARKCARVEYHVTSKANNHDNGETLVCYCSLCCSLTRLVCKLQ